VQEDAIGGQTSSQPVAETDLAALTPTFETTSGGRFRIQLAAVREEGDAERAWELFRDQLDPFISGLQPFFERAETSNGVFYRVQVGPFAESDEADRLCAELKKQNASCFVVAR
jgi:cell division septation protein DedD